MYLHAACMCSPVGEFFTSGFLFTCIGQGVVWQGQGDPDGGEQRAGFFFLVISCYGVILRSCSLKIN